MSGDSDSEVRLPESLSGVEPVQSVRTPIRLEYDYRPSASAESYLRAYAEKRSIGHRSPVDGAVFIPPRGVDPRHGVAISEEVDLPDTGHVGNFCVTHLPIPGRKGLEVPYVSAWLHLAGAAVGFAAVFAIFAIAVWRPDDELGTTAENIRHWEPTGEPDVPLEGAGNRSFHASQPGADAGESDA